MNTVFSWRNTDPIKSGRLNILIFIMILFLPGAAAYSQESPPSIAFFYGPVDSVRELLSYERVVVSPEQISASQIAQLQRGEVRVYAYLSVGEWDNSRGDIPVAADVLTRNTAWDSSVMDLRDNDWRDYLVGQAEELLAAGYDGIFLDTLDSYMLAGFSGQRQQDQQDALDNLLESIARLSSGDRAPLMLNRGFELLGGLAFQPEAVVAESLIRGYDAATDNYFTRTAEDTQWLQDRLNEVKERGVEAIVIDYLQSGQRDARIDAAREISELGFTPYVSNGLLTDFGVSTRYPIPRRLLIFYNGNEFIQKTSQCIRFMAVLTEYAGYVPECYDINQLESLSFDTAKYAGVVYWLDSENYESNEVVNFVETTLRNPDVKSLFIGYLPENPSLLGRLQLQSDDNFQGALSVDVDEVLFSLPSSTLSTYPRYVHSPEAGNSDASVKVTISDAAGAEGVGVLATSWGGVVTQPLSVQALMGDRDRWSLDPFDYVLSLLALPEIPVPDVTTESGRRIFTSHIDGDGFPSKTWTEDSIFAGKSIQQEILEHYDLPQTVSIIEGELAPYGLYPQDSEELEAIAREIFLLDNVEVASHTFSHPFFWDERVASEDLLYGDTLDIPGYTLDYDREVFGSVEYINRELLPADGDKQVEVFLWSGSADPTREIIEKTESLGMLNVNGGNTYVVNGNFSLAQVFPHINWYPTAIQVYAPLLNENLFTNLWTENFGGYARAIESFQLLGEPRRLKPISMYYHMYSGVYPSSIAALHQVYDWALTQEITPLYLSDYAARTRTLYETGMARSIFDEPNQSAWHVTSTGIRSWRIAANQMPIEGTQGIAGMNSGPDGMYLTQTSPRATLVLSEESEQGVFSGRPYLRSANGIIRQWDWQGQDLHIEVESYVPLEMYIAQAENCQIVDQNTQLQGAKQQERLGENQQVEVLTFNSTTKGSYHIHLSCR